MARSGREHDDELPEAQVVSIDGAAQREAPEKLPRRSSAKRLGVLLAAVALFAFGVVVGRGTITLKSGAAQPTRPTSTSSTAPPPSPSPAPSATDTDTDTDEPSAESTSAGSAAARSPAPTNATRLDPRALESAMTVQGPVQALATVGNTLIVLTPGALYRISSTEDGAIEEDLMSSPGLPFGDPKYPSPWELISDGTALFLAAPEVQGRLYQVSTPDLAGLTSLVDQPVATVDLAAMNGVLYQNTASGVFAVTESGDNDAPIARGGTAMAADPNRDRLLVLNNDGAWVVHAYVPGRLEPVATSESLPFAATGIAVADGTIWVAGIRSEDGVPILAQLDPRTLKFTTLSTIGDALTSAPEIVAAGHNLWIRSQYTGAQLWCINALTGAVAQYWDSLPGLVATSGNRAYIADGSLVGEIRLNDACSR